MSKKLYEESDVQAIANAIRTKNGLTDTYTISQMAAAISAIEAGGGGLPEGMATGTFQCTPANMTKEVSIEHGLGAVPRCVIAFVDNEKSSNVNQNMTVLFALTYNNSSCPVSKSITYNAGSTPGVVDFLDTKTADTSTNAYLPASSSAWFFFAQTYRWIAVL